jgi:hypothetical protein
MKRSKDCCSGKMVYKYKLDSAIDNLLIDHILRLDTFDYNNPDGHFLLTCNDGKKRTGSSYLPLRVRIAATHFHAGSCYLTVLGE